MSKISDVTQNFATKVSDFGILDHFLSFSMLTCSFRKTVVKRFNLLKNQFSAKTTKYSVEYFCLYRPATSLRICLQFYLSWVGQSTVSSLWGQSAFLGFKNSTLSSSPPNNHFRGLIKRLSRHWSRSLFKKVFESFQF